MSAAFVLGAVLRVDLHGWTEAPPSLPAPPIRVAAGDGGATRFFYDLLPGGAGRPSPDAFERIGMTLAGLLETWPFFDLPFPAFCVLELGLALERGATAPGASLPSAFLAVLADAEIELRLSFYPDDA